MHHLYNEKSFILGSYDIGETGKIFKLLTENLGLVQAKTTGIRKIESKLKNLTQDFSFVEASLVYGKGGFKMINADLIEHLFYQLNEQQIIFLKNIFNLIIKMSPEEDPESELFKILEFAISLMKKGDREINFLEILIVMKILNHLGYIGDDFDIPAKLFLDQEMPESEADKVFEYIEKNQKKLIKLINESICESQL